MSTEPNRTARQQPLDTFWRGGPFPSPPRPWLLVFVTLISIALVIAGSLGAWLYTEQGPSRALDVRTISGIHTDGIFSLFFALVASVAVLGALLRPTLWLLAWGAFVAMTMCTLVGLFDWVIFDPMDLAYQSTQRADVIRVEWALKLLTFAAPIGALCTLLFARHLMHGDY